MKILLERGRITFGENGLLLRRQLSKKWQALMFIFWLIASVSPPLTGQCTLKCGTTTESTPLSVTVGDDCMISITPGLVLTPDSECPGPKLIEVRNTARELIAEGEDEILLEAGDFLRQVLILRVEDEDSGLFCEGFIRPLDLTAPVVECRNIDLACSADTSAMSIGFPDTRDNCDAELDLTYTDVITENDCNQENILVIERTWTATDDNSNKSSCRQTITVTRINPDNVLFPSNTTVDCNASADPALTGVPTIDGQPIIADDFCGQEVSFTDDTVLLRGAAIRQIKRTWEVFDLCTSATVTEEQRILFEDTEAPAIICPEDLVVSTQPNVCFANVTLPRPELRDNCDPTPLLTVSTSFGAEGLGEHLFVPVGVHSVRYTATDASGNSASCVIQLTVADEEAPTAICQELTVASVPSTGYARVSAQAFDEGSYDNCRGKVYFKVRRMDPGFCDGANRDDSDAEGYQEWFDDHVIFCCEEVGGPEVMVIMRIYEVDPGPGPVDPAREAQGGDLFGKFGECMVAVNIQDKSSPVLECPENRVANCTDDFTDLSVFGSPLVREYCGFELDSTEVVEIDNCGEGRILRSWTAVDDMGNRSVCEQVIEVTNPSELTADQITWPRDTTFLQCSSAGLDPDMLPEGYGRPLVDGEDLCLRIGTNYDDQVFDVASSGCFEILRTWTVIDLCHFDPEAPGESVRFSHLQRIRIVDKESPVLEIPADTIVMTNSSCDEADVKLPLAFARDDCSENVVIRNNSPYAVTGGANASGTYPVGTTEVLFTATDNCGNVARARMTVAVEGGLAPAPTCVERIAAELTQTQDGILTTLEAQTFDAGTESPCGGELSWTIRRAGTGAPPPPATTQLTFTCEDVGFQAVEVWATDENGNSDFCQAVVNVQDNLGRCAPNLDTGEDGSGLVAGSVHLETGVQVEKVAVQMGGTSKMEGITGPDGYYEISEVPFGEDYTVVPKKNDDVMNGISTLDLVLISKHILGINLLASPYRIIAADIDRSGHISTLDLIRLRKAILGIPGGTMDESSSWRFVDAAYKFPDPSNPFLGNFPELYSFNDFKSPEMYVDFVAVKVGDVNNSARATSLLFAEERATDGSLSLQIQDRELSAGTEITVPVSAENLSRIVGYQFGLGFDMESLEFVELHPAGLPAMNMDNFGLTRLEEGVILTSWHEMGDPMPDEETVLFEVTFMAKKTITLREALFLPPLPLSPEAYDRDERYLEVNLIFKNHRPTAEVQAFTLLQNQPNPFRSQTVIAFELADPKDVELNIFDLSGKLIYHRERPFPAGYNEFEVYAADLAVSGILYYQVQAGEASETRKMILIT